MTALIGTVDGAWSSPVTAMSLPAAHLVVDHDRWQVHSVFSSAVNVRAGGHLLTCTTGEGRAPHGVALPRSGLDGLRRLRSGDELVLRGSAPYIYDPSVPSVPGAAAGATTGQLLGVLDRTRPSTGFGSDWTDLVIDPRLAEAVDALRRGRVGAAVIDCLGRGPGLTPSGDDVLVGALAALWAVGIAPAAHVAGRLDVEARRRTTDVSVEYLHYACRGMAIGAVCSLLAALGRGDLVSAEAAVCRLRSFGHSSGMDTLLGVVIALGRGDS